MPLFGAAYAAPNKGTIILYWFRSPKTVLNPPGKNQGLFQAFECFFQVLFKANIIFKDFSRQSCIFKYCSSLCEPWWLFCDFFLPCPNPSSVCKSSLLFTCWPLLHSHFDMQHGHFQTILSFWHLVPHKGSGVVVWTCVWFENYSILNSCLIFTPYIAN